MTETIEKINRDTFESLLPWYVSGRLNDAETRQMQAFLQENPEYQYQVELAEVERGETIQSNEQTGVPSTGALERLMNDISQEKQQSQSWLRKLNALFEPVSNWFGELRPLAMGAAAAVIILQIVVISLMASDTDKKPYKVAFPPTVNKTVATGSYVYVMFKEKASLGEIKQFLKKHSARIVEGPTVNDMFKVRVSKKKLSKQELGKLIQDWKSASPVGAVFRAKAEQ